MRKYIREAEEARRLEAKLAKQAKQEKEVSPASSAQDAPAYQWRVAVIYRHGHPSTWSFLTREAALDKARELLGGDCWEDGDVQAVKVERFHATGGWL